ncbi:MAG TPA: hypothetical protein VMH02_08370 [Verrucomicrobiae bacterium]|nr:hypothetical protein [Verrucomicrobiae bacterium]
MPSRLDFLAAGAIAALAPATAAASPSPAQSASPKASPSPEPSFPPLHFDMAAFDAALETAAPHRHMFASLRLDGGQVLDTMRGVLSAYAQIGVAAKDVHPVAVLYHGEAITLGFDDTVWNDYLIPTHAKDPKTFDAFDKDFASVYTPGKTKGNPELHKTNDKDDSSIEGLVADAGARFFVCNEATKGFASYIARHLKKSPLDVYAAMASNLVPNAMLVPAGVWAVHAVQERRYTYQQVNLQP